MKRNVNDDVDEVWQCLVYCVIQGRCRCWTTS